jgi:hypothetical protein
MFDPVVRRRTRDAIVDAHLAEHTDVGIGRLLAGWLTELSEFVGISFELLGAGFGARDEVEPSLSCCRFHVL